MSSKTSETLGIGLRLRFFLTILAVLLATVAAVSVVHFRFFRTERIRLVDQQLQGFASGLVPNLSIVEFENIDEADQVVSETLGTDRITLLIVIRAPDGSVVYRNRNAQIVDFMAPLLPQWQTLEVQGHWVRMLNFALEDNVGTLQLGLVLDQGQVRWRTLSVSVFLYIALIFVVMVIGAFFLTRLLLRPLRSLAQYVKHLSDSPEGAHGLFVTPEGMLRRTSRKFPGRGDELSELIVAVEHWNQKVREEFGATRAWTAQMAHELKTPLTIVRNSLELIQSRTDQFGPELRDAQEEIDHLGRTISGFLEWMRLENSAGVPDELHALRLGAFAENLVQKINKWNQNRIQFSSEDDFQVFAKPELLSQVLSNLMQNALQYSPQDKAVEVKVMSNVVLIHDFGEGIPESVMKRLGAPFNWGHERHTSQSGSTTLARGSGLGLAWVKTVCEKYGWEFSIEGSGGGTTAKIVFLDT